MGFALFGAVRLRQDCPESFHNLLQRDEGREMSVACLALAKPDVPLVEGDAWASLTVSENTPGTEILSQRNRDCHAPACSDTCSGTFPCTPLLPVRSQTPLLPQALLPTQQNSVCPSQAPFYASVWLP